jgi:hypothetical protein
VIKSVVEVTDVEWRAFKALAAERGSGVAELLGQLVRREVRGDQRRKAQALGRRKAAKQAMDRALKEIREGS